jgi:phosphohistidine swiveling domain-containing protein
MEHRGYKYLGRYMMPVIYCFLLHKWSKNSLGRKYGFPRLSGRTLYLDGHIFFDGSDWETISNFTKEQVEKRNQHFFDGFFKLMDHETKQMLETAKKISRKKIASKADLRLFFKAMNEMEYPWIFILPASDELEEMIKLRLSQNYLPESYLAYFGMMKGKTPIIKQREEAIEIKKYLINKKLFKPLYGKNTKDKLGYVCSKDRSAHKKIIAHVEKYRWFGMMHMWGELFSAEKFFGQLESLDITSRKVKKLPKLPADLEWLKKNTNKLVYWRNYAAEVCSISSCLVLEKLENISHELGTTYDATMWLMPHELFSSMSGGKFRAELSVKDRKMGYGLVEEKGKIKLLTGKKLAKYICKNTYATPNQAVIRGSVACKGKARGAVRLLFSPKELHKIKRGDIIVAPETTPDYMLAIRIAGAIVTDNGGITSHAAIVSRELGIPCVIGTKIATQVLKDGDMVEVDAIKGVVKKLN